MEQPPILGRPKWPGARPEASGDEAHQSAGPATAAGDNSDVQAPLTADHGAPWQPAEDRSLRRLVLATAGVAALVLAACNGGLLWLYDHAPLGVVVTIGTFIAAGALAWLRNRGRQLTVIVLYVQALVGISALVGVLVGVQAGFFTGVFAAGIAFAGLTLLSVTGLVYWTGDRSRTATTMAAGTAVAVLLSMAGAYAFLTWDYHENTYVPPYVKPPDRIVYYLIENGQYYSTDSQGSDATRAVRTFEDYTCPEARQEIAALFGDLVEEGQQRLSSPENLEVTRLGNEGDLQVATVTATVSVIDDFEETVLDGPETWTFHLEKAPGDQYWRVCEIERPT